MAKDLENVRAQVQVLRWARARIAEVKAVELAARDAIEAEMGSEDIGQLDGKAAITWTTHKKRQFQQKKLAEAHPEIAEEFTELVESRTFKVVE